MDFLSSLSSSFFVSLLYWIISCNSSKMATAAKVIKVSKRVVRKIKTPSFSGDG